MDNMDKVNEQPPLVKAIGGLCSCACLAAKITFWVYLGICAFDNPEPVAFYQTEPAQLVGVQNTDATLQPIHDQFVLWFTWMFANVCVAAGMMCVGPMLACCMMHCGEGCSKFIGGLYGCGLCCSGLAAFIAGAVWRFGTAGTFASQEIDAEGLTQADGALLQTSSGKFMYIFYIINFCLMGLCLCCSMIGCLCKCIQG